MAIFFQFLPDVPIAVLNSVFGRGALTLPFGRGELDEEEEEFIRQQANEKTLRFELPKPIDPLENLQLYLTLANLPPLELGHSAPPLGVPGHRMHLNFLAVAPSPHRDRFEKILHPKKGIAYKKAVQKFCDTHIPTKDQPLPDGSPATGYMLTMPYPHFTTPMIGLLPPNSLNELVSWFTMLPFQTMTRFLHVVFPTTRGWDFTFVPYALQFDRPVGEHDGFDIGSLPDPDRELWSTYVWRKRPEKKMELDRYYRTGEAGIGREEILGECKVVMAVQPPWICGEADLKAFVKTTKIQPFDTEVDAEDIPPYKGGERIWAKLWDTCARHRCRHWILSTYHGWIFGAFSEGFSAGRILAHLPFDTVQPTILQCLVYHVACAMGLADNIIPYYPDPVLCIEEMPQNIPPSERTYDLEYPDSGSDWDGMNEAPDVAAVCTQYYFDDDSQSTWGGSEHAADLAYHAVPLAARPFAEPNDIEEESSADESSAEEVPHDGPVLISRMAPSRTDQIFNWHKEVREHREPTAPIVAWEPVNEIIQRLSSPTLSELSNEEIYKSAGEENTDLVMTTDVPAWNNNSQVLFGLREGPDDDEEDDEMDICQ
ncbi:hypothetical protein M422DRAFT_775087 [Sphaerobolus stellatus SS14]|nr:hypothetical protein M422DRAFT_775087 [Sphaerobolus stellatus SS14]